MCFCQVDSPAGSDAISNGKAPITGNAGALARNEREARNDYLAEVLSRSEKILCAYEAVRARAPAFPVIRSDYRNCISTQFVVFLPCFDQNRDRGIGFFPQGEEILIGLARLWHVAGHCSGAAQAQVRERIKRRERIPASMIDDGLEFGCGLWPTSLF